ncbi:MAG: type II toxin-antitoxin system HigB family toxin [Eikenella corrodens]|nr:type II toxin-antitoxin system HigB family toxin [Eikenella corrodens]
MKIIAISTLREFWSIHPDAEQSLKAWYTEAKNADWRTMHDIKKMFASASVLKNNRVVFNIKGNRYRLIASVWFKAGYLYIKFIGTHAEYDTIDAETVERK